MICGSYVLPLRHDRLEPIEELASYLATLIPTCEVIVVDGSPAPVFGSHAASLPPGVRHLRPEPGLDVLNGKVRGVMTGVRASSTDRVVIADEDVRYHGPALSRALTLLERADVVRPQNYFHPLPWHARWDTARSLLNRVAGGDWPGTLAIRRTALLATGGYDGNVLFENLELVRTVRAAGGTEATPLDLYVLRRPPPPGHFWSQRVRQAYDEFARPRRLAVQLALLPAALVLASQRRWRALGASVAGTVLLAETGRRRAGGAHVFPLSASLFSPAWVAERAICAWLAVAARLVFGGVPYRGRVLRRAATPARELRSRHAGALRAAA